MSKVYDWLTEAVAPKQKYDIPQCLELRCTRVADGFAMLLKVDGGSGLLTLLGRENALRLAEVILDATRKARGNKPRSGDRTATKQPPQYKLGSCPVPNALIFQCPGLESNQRPPA